MAADARPSDLVAAYFEAFGRRRADDVVALSHPGIEIWAQPTAEQVGRTEPYRGHDGLRDYLADVDRAWTHFEVTPEDFRAAGQGVIVFGRGRGRSAATGDEISVPLIWVFRLRDGLVVFCRVAKTAAEARELAQA